MNRLMLTAFVALNVLDVASTDKVLAAGGWEANPVQSLSQGLLGPLWWLPKLAMVAAIVFIMRKWPAKYVSIATVVMAAVVTNNYMQ